MRECFYCKDMINGKEYPIKLKYRTIYLCPQCKDIFQAFRGFTDENKVNAMIEMVLHITRDLIICHDCVHFRENNPAQCSYHNWTGLDKYGRYNHDSRYYCTYAHRCSRYREKEKQS